MRVSILDKRPTHPLQPVPADWYPVYINQRQLRTLGLKLSFITDPDAVAPGNDFLLISSRYFAIHTLSSAEKEEVYSTLNKLRNRANKIYWFDFRDSTGTTQFEVLPFVDGYFKKQLLKDLNLYRQKLYGNRIYTDFIHRTFGITDTYEEPQAPLPEKFAYKVGISWNPGLLDFRGGSRTRLAWQRATDHMAAAFGANSTLTWHNPQSHRPYTMLARFNTNYGRDTVAWQRRRVQPIIEALHDNKVMSHDLPLRREIALRAQSKIILSLFGWGEICSRDFQAFIAGAALIAPDTSHLVTWPATHIARQTYWPIRWDLKDLPEAYRFLKDHDDERIRIAAAGQERYKRIQSKAGRREFCLRFVRLLREAPQPFKSTDRVKNIRVKV